MFGATASNTSFFVQWHYMKINLWGGQLCDQERKDKSLSILLAWPQFGGRSWSGSSWVQSHSMYGITRVIGPHQREFRKGGSCLTNIISFYERMTWFEDEEKAVNIVTWNLRKPLMLSPTAFSWRNCLLMACTGALFQRTDWMAEPRKWWS